MVSMNRKTINNQRIGFLSLRLSLINSIVVNSKPKNCRKSIEVKIFLLSGWYKKLDLNN